MIYARRPSPVIFRLLLPCLFLSFPVLSQAQEMNRLLRVTTQPRSGYTRVNLTFLEPPEYRLTRLNNRLELSFPATDAPRFKKLRSYSDPHLSGIVCAQRGETLLVTLPLKSGEPVLPLDCGSYTLSLDVGRSGEGTPHPEILPGREPILNGTEQFVRSFAPPAKASLPFRPTDPKLLQQLFSGHDLELAQAGEELIYREKGAEGVELFSALKGGTPQATALISFRLGEAFYLLERYDAALKAFRQGEALWPDYMQIAPASLLEEYAEALARGGDYIAGRRLLGRLIASFTGEPYAAPLINHLAQLSESHGDQAAALHLYRLVATCFPASPAAGSARMKLADRQMFNLPRERFPALLKRYKDIYAGPATAPLRDEAFFKAVLLESLYGSYEDAIEAAVNYDKLYPRGIFSAIVRTMREELLLVAYRDLHQNADQQGLVRFATEHRDYLARCFQDPEFAPRLADAFRQKHLLNQELDLFGYLAERSFVGGSAPYLTQRLMEDALEVGNLKVAESAGRSFISRFPGHQSAGRVRELLGRFSFDKGNLKEVASLLQFLARPGALPTLPESDYYLGKALFDAKDYRGAERVFARFNAAAAGSPFSGDAYFDRVQSLSALGDKKGALALCREGLRYCSGESADRMQYKEGELALQLKLVRDAAASWQKVASAGKDGVWRTMAQEALNDLQWRLKMAGQLPAPSAASKR